MHYWGEEPPNAFLFHPWQLFGGGSLIAMFVCKGGRGDGCVSSSRSCDDTKVFLGKHLGQFHCSTRHSFSKRLFYIDIAHFFLFDHMWAYGWGWAKTAGSNLERRMHYSLGIALFLPPYLCAAIRIDLVFSPPTPLSFPQTGQQQKQSFYSCILILLSTCLNRHFYHRVISGEGHFTLCPTMGIKEGKNPLVTKTSLTTIVLARIHSYYFPHE